MIMKISSHLIRLSRQILETSAHLTMVESTLNNPDLWQTFLDIRIMLWAAFARTLLWTSRQRVGTAMALTVRRGTVIQGRNKRGVDVGARYFPRLRPTIWHSHRTPKKQKQAVSKDKAVKLDAVRTSCGVSLPGQPSQQPDETLWSSRFIPRMEHYGTYM